jgi:hypothetical protein
LCAVYRYVYYIHNYPDPTIVYQSLSVKQVVGMQFDVRHCEYVLNNNQITIIIAYIQVYQTKMKLSTYFSKYYYFVLYRCSNA